MPWFPEFASAVELARRQTRDAGHADPVGQFFAALNSGDARSLETAWPGEVVIYDPMANVALAEQDYGLALTNELPRGPFDAVILAVKHAPIAEMGEAGIKALLAPGGLIYDLKGILPPSVSHARI
jgi:hypothetical protein